MKTLHTAEEIAQRVNILAAEIARDFEGSRLLVVGVLHGSVILVADLIRKIAVPHQIAFVRASSYGDGTTSSREVTCWLDGLPPLEDRDVLLVDDIFDTGHTLQKLCAELRSRNPRSVRTAVLLWKTARREVVMTPDYFAFEIPDEFVVGYGLDFAGDFRHLPHIAVLEPADISVPSSAPTPRDPDSTVLV